MLLKIFKKFIILSVFLLVSCNYSETKSDSNILNYSDNRMTCELILAKFNLELVDIGLPTKILARKGGFEVEKEIIDDKTIFSFSNANADGYYYLSPFRKLNPDFEVFQTLIPIVQSMSDGQVDFEMHKGAEFFNYYFPNRSDIQASFYYCRDHEFIIRDAGGRNLQVLINSADNDDIMGTILFK